MTELPEGLKYFCYDCKGYVSTNCGDKDFGTKSSLRFMDKSKMYYCKADKKIVKDKCDDGCFGDPHMECKPVRKDQRSTYMLS